MFGPSAPRGAALALILAAACWGLGTVIAKRAVAEIPPILLLTIQLGSSLVFLTILMRPDLAEAPHLGVPEDFERTPDEVGCPTTSHRHIGVHGAMMEP